MADAKFSIGQVNITDYIIVRCRKASDPGPEVARQVFGPNPPTTINLVFLDLDPEEYLFDVYESADGATLSTFFNTFLIDVPTNTILEEWRFYTVGGQNSYDPIQDGPEITDSYLDGKNVVAFVQRGTGPLKPTTEWTRTSTGIALAGGLLFNVDDVFTAVINYRITGTTSTTGAQQEIDIIANTVLDSTYYNKIINLNGTGSRLVVTMDSIANVPDGTEFTFIDEEGGTQLQTKIITQTGEYILWHGSNMPELWVGKSETLKIKKRGTKYKVIQEHANLISVGRRFSSTYFISTSMTGAIFNIFPENGGLYSGDDLPRIWWWINNILTAASKTIDDNVDNPAYVFDPNRPGFFVYSITKKMFRFPNTQGLSEKGLNSFSNFNADSSRLVDYPGGLQPEQVGPHTHGAKFEWNGTDGSTNNGQLLFNGDGEHHGSGINAASIQVNSGTKNIVQNFGVIFCRCI